MPWPRQPGHGHPERERLHLEPVRPQAGDLRPVLAGFARRRYVMSSVNESVFVQNYLEIDFLQTFYPTRGSWPITTGRRQDQALPARPIPRSSTATASGPGRKLARLPPAKARDHVPAGPRPAKANDPKEIQIQYDLYTIPFNGGRRTARPIPGLRERHEQLVPQDLPDGRWLVWVQPRPAS